MYLFWDFHGFPVYFAKPGMTVILWYVFQVPTAALNINRSLVLTSGKNYPWRSQQWLQEIYEVFLRLS